MRIKIKGLLKYILLFFLVLLILLTSLILTMKIPRKNIEDNLQESVLFFKNHQGIEGKIGKEDYNLLHIYADSVLLNLVYCVDSNNAFHSAIIDNFYKKINLDSNEDFINLIENNLEPNTEYLRYWHGSMIIIRPLLTLFNIEQIYLINQIMLWTLAIILLILLWIRNKKIAIMYTIGMIMIVFSAVPLCLEYSWTFYIMFINSIIAILIEKNGDKGLYKLFFTTGILTCFFDFLSTEIITIFVPLLVILFIRKEENRLPSSKETILFIIKSVLLWGIAYIAMWFAKWLLAALVLGKDVTEYILPKAMQRINQLQGISSYERMYTGAITRNLYTLYPIAIWAKKNLIPYIIISLLILLLIIDWKNNKKKWFSWLVIIIGIMPYIRYLILANHSFRHSFFTFRDQLITIIALGIIIFDFFKNKFSSNSIKIKEKKIKFKEDSR